MKKTIIAALLAACSVPALAASYYVVVPVPKRTATAGNILVTLNGYALPAGVVGRAYAGFDFNTVLQVQGDPGFNPGEVRWSVAGGALPAGLALSADGKLTGMPTQAATSGFQVLASYKTKAGEQSYQIVVGDITVSLASATLPEAPMGAAYSFDLKQYVTVAGDTEYAGDGAGVSWSASGALPAGLSMSPDGVLSGTPATPGANTLTVTAAYQSKTSAPASYALTVTANVKANSGYRAWSDNTYAASCNAYIKPTGVYRYTGATGSGIYRISLGGTLSDVYCDMTTAGGGWTLVGRSASGASSTSFGWNYATGAATNDAVPYSLGNVAALKPTQALFGQYAGFLTWGPYAYEQNIPAGFLANYANSEVTVGVPAPVLGGNGAFGMAQVMGYTAYSSGFYFRDGVPGQSYAFFGLATNGWSTFYDDNDSRMPPGDNGYLQGRQGWIFVR